MLLNRRLLSAKIKGFQLEGNSIHKKIKKSKGKKRNSLWEEKRSLGKHARSHILAYGFSRYLDYSIMEKNPKTRPDYFEIAQIFREHPIGFDLQCCCKMTELDPGLVDMRTTLSQVIAAICSEQTQLQKILDIEKIEQIKKQPYASLRRFNPHDGVALKTTLSELRHLKRKSEEFNRCPLMWLLDKKLNEYNHELYSEIMSNVRID